MGEIGRRKRGSTLRRAAIVGTAFLLALSLATAGVAQTNATTTIPTTAHDFSLLDGPGYKVTAAENHCEVCHGPPVIGGPAYPEWRHTSSPSTDYDTANWLYTIGDGLDAAGAALDVLAPVGDDPTMVAGWMVEDCMGCHEGDIAVDDYVDADGNPVVAVPSVFIAGTEAFGTAVPGTYNPMEVHHPVDIVYNAALATAQGALEDPTAFLNPQGGGTIADTLLDYAGKLNCKSCHEQHNDRRFDLAGGDPSDDPEPGATSEEHDFLKFDRLCFNCHTHDQPHDGIQHHIPGRDDPFGDLRSSDMNCTLCHRIDPAIATGSPYLPACYDCHRDFTRGTPWADRGTPGTATTLPDGHHGGDRDLPYFDCAACHADPLTGILTGNDFGLAFAKSCYDCHDDLWNDGGNTPPAGLSVAEAVDHDGDPATPDQVYGTVDELVELTAVVATNTEGDALAYQWNFGDGSSPPFPSHDPEASHTYLDYQYRGIPVFKASVSVTDGVNAPIYYEFDVIISEPEGDPGVDKWTIDLLATGVGDDFDVTFENHDGALVAYRDGQLAYGVEYVGVIFWMELWMDLSGENAFWGVGDMYFGNVDRDAGTMDGLQIREDGTIDTYTGVFSGVLGGGH